MEVKTMAYSPKNTPCDKIDGQFQEKEFKNFYEYTQDTQFLSEWDIKHGATHRIFVATLGETRPAVIKQTVVYVMIDEDIWEKWNIKQIWQREQ